MKLLIIRNNKNPGTGEGNDLLRSVISSEPAGSIILDALSRTLSWPHNNRAVYAVPKEWNIEADTTKPKLITYTADVPISSEFLSKTRGCSWFVICNARFAAQINNELLDKLLGGVEADVVAVNAKPDLLAYTEKVRLTTKGKVAGFRRLFSDSAELASIPADWPCRVFIKTNVLDQVLGNRALPQSFSDFVIRCRANRLTVRAINVAGTVLDLETQCGLLSLCRTAVGLLRSADLNHSELPGSARFIGKVLLGTNVDVGSKVIVAGPSIICNDAKIAQGTVINSCIICNNVSVPRDQFVQNRIIERPQYNWKQLKQDRKDNSKLISCHKFDLSHQKTSNNSFRTRPRFSYTRCFKRLADIVIATIVLALFAPFFPVIALAIKLTSKGPIFFKDLRQGLYGKEFNCLKFRTMIIGAEKIQEKLRALNQTDGPQFKMVDDPRINAVGRFLRDTYIDEIPQFFNVLLGQMSVIGPRPSPESENTQCPPWRDARLSVRPGITGLWQVCRTRQPMKDFQEWIHYDIKYVRGLSLKVDLWIYWQTVKELLKNFIQQF